MFNTASAIPGDLKKFEVRIGGENVTNMVISTNIYLDLVGGFWTAQIMCEDGMNLLTMLGIKSGVEVKVKLQTEFDGSVGNGIKEFEFEVYNITDKIAANHMMYNYTIHCASKPFIIDQKTRVTKAFSSSADAAVEAIASDFLGASVRESKKSEGDVQFISTNWTPMNAIAFASKFATYKGRADFMFFQVNNNAFDFMPVSEMYKSRRAGHVFIQRPYGIRENGEPKDDYDPALLITAFQNDHYDAVKAGLRGYFESQNASFDVISKTWSIEDFTGVGVEGQVGEFEGFAEANISFTPKHADMYRGAANIYDTSQTWMGSRRSELMKLDREKIFVQTSACTTAWELLGHTVKVNLPSMEDYTPEPFDTERRGWYLVTAVAYVLNRAKAVVNYEMVKIKLRD